MVENIGRISKGLVVSCLLLIFVSCAKDDEKPAFNKEKVNGYVQKGPFLNGSSIGIYELDDQHIATGKVFSTQMADNSGLFQIDNISLISPYVQLKADGYYFNEVTGENSSAPITLYAFTDISDKTSINVNILSHLEKDRIQYLVKNGLTLLDAKKQANKEILKIFSISNADWIDSDMLDISQEGDNNAILLAISLITQGFRTESELSELLANIITDIRADGELNNLGLGSLLISDARLFILPEIRAYIETRYTKLGMNVVIPDFEKYVKEFVANTSFQPTNEIEYPANSAYGENILNGDKTLFSSRKLSIAANLPKGTSLKVVIISNTDGWGYALIPNGPVNWSIVYDQNSRSELTVIEYGKSCDLQIFVTDQVPIIIEYYENNATTPTKTKTITVNSAG